MDQSFTNEDPWRNGSASDSRSEGNSFNLSNRYRRLTYSLGCPFKSGWVHFFANFWTSVPRCFATSKSHLAFIDHTCLSEGFLVMPNEVTEFSIRSVVMCYVDIAHHLISLHTGYLFYFIAIQRIHLKTRPYNCINSTVRAKGT